MKEKKTVYLISGLSGAGKTYLLKALEDQGYYTVDNVPPELIKSFLNIVCTSEFNKIAVVSDIRWKKPQNLFEEFSTIHNHLTDDIEIKKVFLESQKDILVKRFRKSRRTHPLGSPVEDALEQEIRLLEPLRSICDIVIDTSNLEPTELSKRFFEIVREDRKNLKMNIMSFGFKNGLPENADYIYDVRYLPNPFYEFDLYKLTGKDKAVEDYLKKYIDVDKTIDILLPMVEYIQDVYTKAGRIEAYFCIGCTGGKHRSVYIAQRIYEILKEKGKEVKIYHRDIDKE